MGGVPETRYAVLGEDRIAYQVIGEGPIDLLYVPSMGDCIDLRWDYPPYADFLHRLASFSRLIQFDHRGIGASDRPPDDEVASWEWWAEDARAVLDTVGSERAAILGILDSGPTAMLFAAAHPDRTHSLVLANTGARFLADGEYAGLTSGVMEELVEAAVGVWGTELLGEFSAGPLSIATNPEFCSWLAKTTRITLSPRQVGTWLRRMFSIDVRDVLPAIRVPALVMYSEDVQVDLVAISSDLAENLADARCIAVPGDSTVPYLEPGKAAILAEIEEFLTGTRSGREADRILASVLFTDLVGSTEMAAALGDSRWRQLLESHNSVSRTVVEQHRGRLIKTTGDGILATFEGPGRAIQCARSLRDALSPLGLTIRAGLHTGEVELLGEDIGGVAVHVAARVLGHARANELLVSAAVPMLVAGSGLEFEARGEYDLKGLDGTWTLFALKT